MLKRPAYDPALEPFDGGVAVLKRNGEVAGHVATSLSTFWSPSRPFSLQHWVWYIVVWINGDREPSDEDYPPEWPMVKPMQHGVFEWERGDAHDGEYTVEWLPADERQAALTSLNIEAEDF
jgi:hypothetical protein